MPYILYNRPLLSIVCSSLLLSLTASYLGPSQLQHGPNSSGLCECSTSITILQSSSRFFDRFKEKYNKVMDNIAASTVSESTERRIDDSNVGNKMLQVDLFYVWNHFLHFFVIPSECFAGVMPHWTSDLCSSKVVFVLARYLCHSQFLY